MRGAEVGAVAGEREGPLLSGVVEILGGEGTCALGQVSVCRIEDESIGRGCEDAKP